MKVEILKNGTTILLRELSMEDKERSLNFFRALSADDRRYLRVDVTKSEIVERRIQQGVDGKVFRLAALVNDEIVGDGALEFGGEQLWRDHIGEMRIIVSNEYRGKGLGNIIIREIVRVAEQREIEKIVVKMQAPQTSVRAVCEKLGFRVDAEVPNYVKDQDGNLQSLVIMSCTLDEWWREMKDFDKESSWHDG